MQIAMNTTGVVMALVSVSRHDTGLCEGASCSAQWMLAERGRPSEKPGGISQLPARAKGRLASLRLSVRLSTFNRPDHSGWVRGHDSIRWQVPGDDCSCAYYGVLA